MIIDGRNLYPGEGFKYITNGTFFSDWTILGKTDTPENWHDTNDEPPVPPEPGEEATTDDYEAALNRLGVET